MSRAVGSDRGVDEKGSAADPQVEQDRNTIGASIAVIFTWIACDGTLKLVVKKIM